jgi:hypothetical protein
MALLNFDATQVEPTQAFEPLPAGTYAAFITESDFTPTKNGLGSYLKLKFQIIEGEYTGRVLFTNLNLDNPNKTAVEIAQRDLSAICHAVGVLQASDSQQLHDRPMMIKVGIQPARDGHEASNSIKGYEAYGQTVKTPPAAAPAAASNTPPWKK